MSATIKSLEINCHSFLKLKIIFHCLKDVEDYYHPRCRNCRLSSLQATRQDEIV